MTSDESATTEMLFIDDHNGGYWTTGEEWEKFCAEATGEITFRVLEVKSVEVKA